MGAHVDEKWFDAAVRAMRTFYTSVGVDIAVAIGAGILLALNSGDVMTPAFWVGVLALVVRSTVTGIATYFVRLKVTPKAIANS